MNFEAFLATNWSRVLLWTTILAITGIIIYEIIGSSALEGFIDTDSSMGVGRSAFWGRLVPRRSDVGPELEVIGINRQKKYFAGYADVQRFSEKTDFCRMVNQSDQEEDMFFACGLGGTDNTSSISYKSPTVKQGLKLSRDDYMRDSNGDGRDDYCRIIKNDNGQFEAQCNPATDSGFDLEMLVDPNPTKDIKILLEFYAGIMFWLRLYDDTLDYAQNLIIKTGGGAKVGEFSVESVDGTPPSFLDSIKEKNPSMRKITKTTGMTFNGVNQYIRIGDDRKLGFGTKVLPRQMRAVSFWVKFDEFTNNAHIFDFGNGGGVDNVWCGIQGRGNSTLGADNTDSLKKICEGIGQGNETLPDGNSGQQPELEVSPQKLMKTTCANTNDFSCPDMQVAAVVPSKKIMEIKSSDTADMIYEIWEKKVRKMRIKVPGMFRAKEWIHIVITTAKSDSFRPDIKIYKNGEMAFIQPSGWMPTTSKLASNFIGKSNWQDQTSQYANKDELFKGSIFDFRAYNVPLSDKIIKETVHWGKVKLGMESNVEDENDI